jgi:hypothetical protein
MDRAREWIHLPYHIAKHRGNGQGRDQCFSIWRKIARFRSSILIS